MSFTHFGRFAPFYGSQFYGLAVITAFHFAVLTAINVTVFTVIYICRNYGQLTNWPEIWVRLTVALYSLNSSLPHFTVGENQKTKIKIISVRFASL